MIGVMDEVVPDEIGAARRRRGVFLAAVGAAVQVIGSMEIVDSALVECSAVGAKVAAMGGAVFVDSGAHLEVHRSVFRQNWVAGGSFGCLGGAVFLFAGANATLRDSIASENAASDSPRYTVGGAIALLEGARMSVHTSEVRKNSATSDGQYAMGGGFWVSSAQLVVSESLFRDNLVDARGAASSGLGAAISGNRRSHLTVQQTELHNNTAHGVLFTSGGALDVNECELMVVQSTFEGNSAVGTQQQWVRGGAINGDGAVISIRDSDLRRNSVIGANTYGGAIYLEVDSAVLTNVSLIHNRAIASKDFSRGGAIHVAQGVVSLNRCRLHDNIAESLQNSLFAVGGGISVASGDVRIVDSAMRGNRFGGLGLSQNQSSDEAGAHVHADGGAVVLDGCSVLDSGGGEETSLDNVARFLLSAKQSLVLRSSFFHSRQPGRGLLRLSDSALQLVIRGCTVINLFIDPGKQDTTIGIVNTTFSPALNAAVPTVQPNPNCGKLIGGVPLCDPRAACTNRSTGGVQCACTGIGLHDKPGTFPDGQQCSQEPSVSMLLQSQELSVTVSKPSIGGTTVQVVVGAGGESRMVAVYSASMVHRSAKKGDGAQRNSSRIWSRLDEQRLSLDGHHVVWSPVPPANDSIIELDGGFQRYTATKMYSFQLGLDCHSEPACAADGDTVETVLEVASGSGLGGVQSAVRITTHVQSVISCDHSKARIEYDLHSVSASTAMRVHLDAYDVDSLPVSFTRAEINIMFDDQAIPMQWSRGSNEYSADLPAELTKTPGLFHLVVSARNAWNDTGPVTSCELLRRTITVKDGFSTNWILAGAGGAAIVVIGGLVIVVRKRHQNLQAIMVMLFTEV
jgi:hypothetical protein